LRTRRGECISRHLSDFGAPILVHVSPDSDIRPGTEFQCRKLLLPSIADTVARDTPPELHINAIVQGDASEVRCDVHLMETVLKNLLYNASRYARRSIDVTFTCDAGLNRLLVDDDGPGIPEADRQRVFDSFVQLDRTAGRKTGFGLGLAIVKRAIEWHGGQVSVTESPLGGARFCVVWPVMA